MSKELDLLEIARQEAAGNAFGALNASGMFQPSELKPDGFPDAVIWQGNFGDHGSTGGIVPVTHALTDKFALIGTIAALDVLGLPFRAVPMMAQYRHTTRSWHRCHGLAKCRALWLSGQLLEIQWSMMGKVGKLL